MDSDQLVVTTPERVAFDYKMAGIGSRLLAQAIDWVVIALLFEAALLVTIVIEGATGGSGDLGSLILLIFMFFLIFGYFWALEAAWSGLTVGKYALGMRTVDDQGGPLTFSQAAIRNLVRILDFLPVAYGVGIVTLFIGGPAKRLGDFVAGTLVIREGGISSGSGLSPAPLSSPPPPGGPRPRLSPAQLAVLRSMEPELRRFVSAYAERAPWLHPYRRAQLAAMVAGRLHRLVPEVVQTYGPLVALDQLAGLLLADAG